MALLPLPNRFRRPVQFGAVSTELDRFVTVFAGLQILPHAGIDHG